MTEMRRQPHWPEAFAEVSKEGSEGGWARGDGQPLAVLMQARHMLSRTLTAQNVLDLYMCYSSTPVNILHRSLCCSSHIEFCFNSSQSMSNKCTSVISTSSIAACGNSTAWHSVLG